MRADAIVFLIIGLLFLAGTVAAEDASTLSKSSGAWIVANGADHFMVNANVRNLSGPVAGAHVVFSVNNSVFGSVDSGTFITGTDGLAAANFTVGHRSGTVTITATITYDDAGTSQIIVKSIPQDIDHDTLVATFSPGSGQVGEVINFNTSITDQWGNPIDTRRYPDKTVTLSVSCPMPNDCEFVGHGHTYSGQPDEYGNLVVSTKLGTKTGVTAVVMSPVQNLDQDEAFIDTLPSSIVDFSVHLNPGTEVNIGSGTLEFSYTLIDQYGNPLSDRQIYVQTSLGENQTTSTNSAGQTPTIIYGPKNSACVVDIDATVLNWTPLLENTFNVTFKSAEPTLNLVVSPTTMSSRDYVPPTQASVLVTVRDDMGNAFTGQDVTLTLSSLTSDANWTHNPYLGTDPNALTLHGTTDAAGTVSTVFNPGNLTEGTDWQGSCLLTASWGNLTKSTTLTWNNHPYVNIYTSVSPTTVAANDVINVTIRVVVNGKTGMQGPLTVVMDQDATGNMGRKSKTNPSMTAEQEADLASKIFIEKLNPAKTRMGMESFGDATGGTIGRLPIPSMFSTVEAEYDKLYNLKLTGSAQDYYGSLSRSADKIIADGHPENVKIIVFLSDGGSVLKESDKQALVDKCTAASLGTQPIRIMTITYTNNAQEPSGAAQLRDLSTRTGGTAYIARNADELAARFQELIDLINILCGEGSIMTASFDVVPINSTYTATQGSAFEYVPMGIPANQYINSPSPASSTTSLDARTIIRWPNSTRSMQNQSAQWPDLQFNVGRINLTSPPEEWSTTFSLRVKEVGCYNVFNSSSYISLDDGSMPSYLPGLPICVNKSANSSGLGGAVMDLSNIQTGAGPFTEFIPVTWDTKYNTTHTANSVAENLYFRVNGGVEKKFSWTAVSALESNPAPNNIISRSAKLDIRSLPSGNHTISIRIHGTSTEGIEDELFFTQVIQKQYYPPYIKLE